MYDVIIEKTVIEGSITLGAFIGDLGGLLMIILIVVLLFKFIAEINIFKESSTVKKISFFAVMAAVTGLLEIVIGGYIYNFICGAAPVLDIQRIWNMKPVSTFFLPERLLSTISGNESDMALVTDGTYTSDWLVNLMNVSGTGMYSFDNLLSDGIFPLYPLLVSLLSKALYNLYIDCAFYISFLSGIATVVCMGMWLDRKYGYERAKSYIMMFLCLPGIFFLFLPSPFALFMALFMAFLLCLEYRYKAAMVIFAILCAATHISGILAIVLLITAYVYGKDKKYSDMVYALVILVSQFIIWIVCYSGKIGSGIEYWFPLTVPVMMVSGYGKKSIISDNVIYKASCLALVLLGSFYLAAKIHRFI